jgi:hypothetical protein
VRQWTKSFADAPQQFVVSGLVIWSNKFLFAMGVSFAPLLAAVMAPPCQGYGKVPYDLLLRLDVLGSTKPEKGRLNFELPEDRETFYPDGQVVAHVEHVDPRQTEYLFTKGIPLSKALCKQRYQKYSVDKSDAGLVPDDIFTWEFEAFGVKDSMPKGFTPDNFTFARNPGFFCVDMVRRPDFDNELADQYRFFAIPLVDLMDKAPDFEAMDPADPVRSPLRIVMKTEAEGDALVLDSILRFAGRQASSLSADEMAAFKNHDVNNAALGRTPGIWMQTPVLVGARKYRLPFFSIWAIRKDHVPLNHATIVQPSFKKITAVEEEEEDDGTGERPAKRRRIDDVHSDAVEQEVAPDPMDQ